MTPKSVCTPPSGYYAELEDVYKVSRSYTDYIQALCTRNPSLRNLYSFLANPRARKHGCLATALDFREGTSTPTSRRIPDMNYLSHEFAKKIDLDQREEKAIGDSLQGRILIIEDLTVDIIQLVGSELDIDPLFLANHLHVVHRTGMRHQTPDDATLPSRLSQTDYVNISYHQPVTCDKAFPYGDKFTVDASINRKLVFLRATSIGLAQHRVSIIKIRRNPKLWIALVLVDPPLGDSYFRSEDKNNAESKVHLNLTPFLGMYENFMDLPKFSETQAWSHQEATKKGGMMDDLVRYWEKAVPSCFDPLDPTIQSLAYYPLRIVAAEWVKYIAVMQRCIKMYEYQGNQLDLEKFNMDLRELQGWRRRSMVSQQKIRTVIRHLKSHNSSNPIHRADVDEILEDFEVIKKDIEDAGRRLETMLPVVTSLIQIIDARQSFAETADISRLTVLALVFVPLSYVSSLFSMNSETMPGSEHFWVYFVVAIPVTIIVFLIARPPTMERIREAGTWFPGLRRRRVNSSLSHTMIEERRVPTP